MRKEQSREVGDLSNAAIAREVWMAVANSEADKIRGMLAPDIVWRTHASGALTGEVRGPDRVIDLFARSGELVDDLASSLIDIYESERGAVLLYRVQASRGLTSIDTLIVLVMSVEGGLISEVFTVPVDPESAHHFWLSN